MQCNVVKKTVHDKLVAKVNSIDTSGFALRTKYNADKTKLKKNIPDTSKLVKKLGCNAKIRELKNEISSISGLVTTSVLTTVENKIPIVGNLVKEIDKKIMSMKIKLQIISMINILLLQNLIS